MLSGSIIDSARIEKAIPSNRLHPHSHLSQRCWLHREDTCDMDTSEIETTLQCRSNPLLFTLFLLLVGSSSRGDMLSCLVLVSEICGSRSGVFGSGRLPVCIINWVAFFHDPLSIHPGEIRLETVWEPLVNLFPAGAPPAARQFQASLLFSLPLPNWTGSCMFFNSNRILGWLAQYEQHLSFSYGSAFLFVCESYSRIWNIDKRLLFWQTFFFLHLLLESIRPSLSPLIPCKNPQHKEHSIPSSLSHFIDFVALFTRMLTKKILKLFSRDRRGTVKCVNCPFVSHSVDDMLCLP